jgi:hypothetical protein
MKMIILKLWATVQVRVATRHMLMVGMTMKEMWWCWGGIEMTKLRVRWRWEKHD